MQDVLNIINGKFSNIYRYANEQEETSQTMISNINDKTITRTLQDLTCAPPHMLYVPGTLILAYIFFYEHTPQCKVPVYDGPTV